MKILKKGKKIPIWVGRKFTHKRCGAILQLEECDAKKVHSCTDRKPIGCVFQFKCPECNGTITFTINKGNAR